MKIFHVFTSPSGVRTRITLLAPGEQNVASNTAKYAKVRAGLYFCREEVPISGGGTVMVIGSQKLMHR